MEKDLIEDLRNRLQPGGTLNVVNLQIRERYFDKEFVDACINQIQKLNIKLMLGGKINALEQLAIMLLCDSAYIDIQDYVKGNKDNNETN